MKKSSRSTLLAVMAALLLMTSGYLLQAQEAPAPAQADGQTSAGAQRAMGPARGMDERMNRLQEQLKATDAEWATIKPLVTEVMMAQRKAMSGMRGRGRMGRMQENRADRPANPETEALTAAADDSGTSDADLKAKLDAYREMVKKSQDELKAAREKLRKAVTLRQEAKLVLMGILD